MSAEGTAPVQTCCVCAQREPIACGVCLGVSTLSDDVMWFARRMEQLHAELAAARAEVIEQTIKRTEAEEVADDRRKQLEELAPMGELGWYLIGDRIVRVTEVLHMEGRSDDENRDHLAWLRGEWLLCPRCGCRQDRGRACGVCVPVKEGES